MSIRPSRVASEATAFSLRDIVSFEDANHAQHAQHAHLDFIGTPAPVAPLLSIHTQSRRPESAEPLPTKGFTFNLDAIPAIKPPGPVAPTAYPTDGKKMISSGYLTGGSNVDKKEVMRLHAQIDSLRGRVAKAEEQATHATALLRKSETLLHGAQSREAKAQAETQAIVRKADERLRIAMASGTELQSRCDAQTAQIQRLEGTLFSVTNEKQTLMKELETACEAKAAAEAELHRAADAAPVQAVVPTTEPVSEPVSEPVLKPVPEPVPELTGALQAAKETIADLERRLFQEEANAKQARAELETSATALEQARAAASETAIAARVKTHVDAAHLKHAAHVRDLNSRLDELKHKFSEATGELAKAKQRSETLEADLKAAWSDRDKAKATLAARVEQSAFETMVVDAADKQSADFANLHAEAAAATAAARPDDADSLLAQAVAKTRLRRASEKIATGGAAANAPFTMSVARLPGSRPEIDALLAGTAGMATGGKLALRTKCVFGASPLVTPIATGNARRNAGCELLPRTAQNWTFLGMS